MVSRFQFDATRTHVPEPSGAQDCLRFSNRQNSEHFSVREAKPRCRAEEPGATFEPRRKRRAFAKFDSLSARWQLLWPPRHDVRPRVRWRESPSSTERTDPDTATA